MEILGLDINCLQFVIRNNNPFLYSRVSDMHSTVNPAVVVVDAIRFMTVSSSSSGFPLQLMLINENNLCSILFHLLVPGGKCVT